MEKSLSILSLLSWALLCSASLWNLRSSFKRSSSSSSLSLFLCLDCGPRCLSSSSSSTTAVLGPGVFSGMEAIRTGGVMECFCPNASSTRTNQGQVAAVGFPPTPSPDPGNLQS
ncbi:unnamed protein product [Arctogadus glacialis]